MFAWIKKHPWWSGFGVLVFIGLVGSWFPDAEKPSSASSATAAKAPAAAASLTKPADDGCNQDNAILYVERWRKDKSQMIVVVLEQAAPKLIIQRRTWDTLGPALQIGTVGILDCAIAGPGKHMMQIVVAEGMGMEPYAKFDGVELINARKVAAAAVDSPPVD
jgi:hypothetical protein